MVCVFECFAFFERVLPSFPRVCLYTVDIMATIISGKELARFVTAQCSYF